VEKQENKSMKNYRDRNLLDLARGQHCLFRLPGICNSDAATVVAAHSNSSAHGKGGAMKASDVYSVWGCSRCHTWYDSSMSATRAQREYAFAIAHERQVIAWKAISENPCLKPKNVRAAREALAQLQKLGAIA
jgi:hypothetical protein